QDIFIACVDGLKGFPDAIEAVFPKTTVQLCIVHMVRHSLAYDLYALERMKIFFRISAANNRHLQKHRSKPGSDNREGFKQKEPPIGSSFKVVKTGGKATEFLLPKSLI
ncbi:hypothetical protein RB25_06920, partial [Herbaspirillum rubrisubalbicans]